jgi:hypothetical protein
MGLKEDKSENNRAEINDLLLETLSFYEAMSLEKIIMDIDSRRAKEIENFNKETLEQALNDLKKKKLLKIITENKQKAWIKVFKSKRPWWVRLFLFKS